MNIGRSHLKNVPPEKMPPLKPTPKPPVPQARLTVEDRAWLANVIFDAVSLVLNKNHLNEDDRNDFLRKWVI